MAQWGVGDSLNLILVGGNIVVTLGGEILLAIPVDQFCGQFRVGFLVVIDYQVDNGRTGPYGATQGALAAVTPGGMVEHAIRHLRIGKADLFFHKAEDPQPGSATSATF